MSKFSVPMMFFSFSGCALRYAFVPQISGTHWKLIVRFGRGSLPSLMSLRYARPISRVSAQPELSSLAPCLMHALVQVAADRRLPAWCCRRRESRRARIPLVSGTCDALHDRADGDLVAASSIAARLCCTSGVTDHADGARAARSRWTRRSGRDSRSERWKPIALIAEHADGAALDRLRVDLRRSLPDERTNLPVTSLPSKSCGAARRPRRPARR